jgi:hypothetical protein
MAGNSLARTAHTSDHGDCYLLEHESGLWSEAGLLHVHVAEQWTQTFTSIYRHYLHKVLYFCSPLRFISF